MAKAKTKQEVRKFSVHPQIIFDLIKSQAGTLAKAFLECIMNSVDAGATRVDLHFNQKTFTIADDGIGFKTRKEIEDWFEVFGFPHEEGQRTYGKFGIGRAQLWAFASTVWRTNTFAMDVDIQKRGLDYHLDENLKKTQGVGIEGQFYETLSASDLVATERELSELAKYVVIPVTVNGKNLSADPATEKWTHDTPEAWIHLNPNSSTMAVYNLGVLVRKYSSYQVGGCGGKVVTKPGVRLDLNMARNDILVASCKVWKKIRPFLQNEADKVRATKPRLSEHDRQALVSQVLAGDRDGDQLKLITDITGRHHTPQELRCAFWRYDSKLTVGEKGCLIADQAHKQKLAFVLDTQTLDRFGANDAKDFLRIMRETFPRFKGTEVKCFNSAKKAVPTLNSDFVSIPEKELTKQEIAALRALQAGGGKIRDMLGQRNWRSLHVGTSKVADGWTDGCQNVWINRNQLKKVKEGLAGMIELTALLLHEYLHEEADAGTHTHDEEFYERFHDYSFVYGKVPLVMMQVYANACNKAGIRLVNKVLTDMDSDLEVEQRAA